MKKILVAAAMVVGLSIVGCGEDDNEGDGGSGGGIGGEGGGIGGEGGGVGGEGGGIGGEGGGGDGVANCAWLQDENNCWRTFVAAIDCLPAAETAGVFNEARTECTYDGGEVVTFAEAVPAESLPEEWAWEFELTAGDEACLSLVEDGEGFFSITAHGETFQTEVSATEFAYVCPDGSRFATSDPAGLLECGLENLPGYASTVSSFALGGAGEAVVVWMCDDAAP